MAEFGFSPYEYLGFALAELCFSPPECLGSGEAPNRYRGRLDEENSRPQVVVEIRVIGGRKVPRGVVVGGL